MIFNYDTLPEDIKNKLFYCHTHTDLCPPEEIVYMEKDVIEIINYIFKKLKK